MQNFTGEIHTVIAASADTWEPPVFGPTLAIACSIAWLNISGVMRLPPDEGPAGKDVLEPVARDEAGNTPDDNNSPYLQNHCLQFAMGIYLLAYWLYFLFQYFLLILLPVITSGQ
jgi:hypothetical protein